MYPKNNHHLSKVKGEAAAAGASPFHCFYSLFRPYIRFPFGMLCLSFFDPS